MEARIAPCRVGILGTSLSAIDAAVAVVARHGVFHTEDDKTTHFPSIQAAKRWRSP